jgi:hypothetical protein
MCELSGIGAHCMTEEKKGPLATLKIQKSPHLVVDASGRAPACL